MLRDAPALELDARSLDALRRQAARDPRAALREAAVQFEALFTQMLLKSMRDAMPRTGMFEGPGHGMYEGMLDQHWARALAGRPGGLAEAIARQLERQFDAVPPDEAPAQPAAPTQRVAPAHAAAAAPGRAVRAEQAEAADAAAAAAYSTAGRAPQLEFVRRMWPHAQAAERATGVPAAFIVGQAALESGWGRHEIIGEDGQRSFNLFGIKAGRGWEGAVARTSTTEYVDGSAVRTVASFRAYESYAHAFRDWAALIAESPRYGGVVRSAGSVAGFAQGLQRAGYATDPEYADKLTRTINQALQLQRLAI